jgi:dynein heavy chain
LKTPQDFVRLWLHEASRVYGDKFIEDRDIELFSKLKYSIAQNLFDVSCAAVNIRYVVQYIT